MKVLVVVMGLHDCKVDAQVGPVYAATPTVVIATAWHDPQHRRPWITLTL
jgi:hypothetical protein